MSTKVGRKNQIENIPLQTGRMILICKVCCCFTAVAIGSLAYLMRVPDQVRFAHLAFYAFSYPSA